MIHMISIKQKEKWTISNGQKFLFTKKKKNPVLLQLLSVTMMITQNKQILDIHIYLVTWYIIFKKL